MKYHVPTGIGFSPKASGFYPFDDATDLAGEGRVGDVVWLIQASASNHTNQRDGSFGMPLAYTNQKNRPFGLCGLRPRLEIRHATALTTGAKHWHRQKAVFYVFCFCAPSIYPLNHFYGIAFKNEARAEAFSLQPSLFFHIIICVAFTLPCRLQSRRQVSCLASRVK